MADDEILQRLDAHLARGNELIAEVRAEFAANRDAQEVHRRELVDIRFELSQMSMRGERVAQAFLAELREMRAEREALRGEREALRAEAHQEHVDYLEENRAQRQALFAILDELKRRGGGPAAAGA